MNKFLTVALIAGSLATATATVTTSAEAFPGKKVKICKTVTKVVIKPFGGKSVITKRVCRIQGAGF